MGWEVSHWLGSWVPVHTLIGLHLDRPGEQPATSLLLLSLPPCWLQTPCG